MPNDIKTYEEALDYLYSATPAFHQIGAAAYKPGLQNTLLLMDALGHPERQWPAVHIAGTNGKGSTSHLIAASLQAAGMKVGLYTSPHLVDYRERIRVNGQMIPRERVVDFVREYQDLLEQIRPSFFEITMALAFTYFAEQQVDIAVIEVGLGGRLDSTNIITPVLSVITNIGLDHTEFLGNTLAAIAREKAGIIKPGVPVVIGENHPETDPVFLEAAEEQLSPLIAAESCSYLRRRRERLVPECELTGSYQQKNMQTAYVALKQLHQMGIVHTGRHDEAIREGFAHVCTLTGLMGRWQTISHQPCTTICDTGHNSHGLRYVATSLASLIAEGHGLHIVFGMVDDKDVEVVLSLMPKQATYYFTQAHTHRAIPATRMQELAHPHSLIGNTYPTVETAITAAQSAASVTDVIFIGGSNYVVGEALQIIEKQTQS